VTVDQDAFRAALSRFATGITVVTVEADGTKHGMTASSFASVSLDPPRVLVCLDKSSRTRALLSDTFAINILSSDQETVSRAFAHAGDKPFSELAHEAGPTSGAPLLKGALAWIECATSSIVDGGDHDIVVGDVTGCTSGEGQPLIYYSRTYRTLD
jgi:flavin reductase (DIM6/NTAB) family NADH-FMN oxidoreductase RutF